jgi:hypothetical protein
MQELIPILNFILALGGVVTLFAAGVLFFDLYTKNYSLSGYVLKYGTAAALILTLISTILTLIYSEVFGFIPCGLCWLQRVFLYPQVIMLAIALKLRDSAVYVYGIALYRWEEVKSSVAQPPEQEQTVQNVFSLNLGL